MLQAMFITRWGGDRGKEPMHPDAEYEWLRKSAEKAQSFSGVGKVATRSRWNDCHYGHGCRRKARGG